MLTTGSRIGTGLDHGLPYLDQLPPPLPLLAVLGGGPAVGLIPAAFITKKQRETSEQRNEP